MAFIQGGCAVNASILTLADPGYLKRAANIVELYNEYSGCAESPQLQKPSSTLILAVDGDAGGLLLDRCALTDGTQDFYRVIFAAFEPQNRGKGALKVCLDHAQKNGIDIRFVELNVFDDSEEIWAKVGYEHIGIWGFTLVASRKKESFIHYGVTRKKTNHTAQDNNKKRKESASHD